MSELSNDATKVITNILTQMLSDVSPPKDADSKWLANTKSLQAPSLPSQPYNLLAVTEWARITLTYANNFRDKAHQFKSMTGGYSFDTWDGENYDIELGMHYADLLPEVYQFFWKHPHWVGNVYGMSEAMCVHFNLKIPLVKKQIT
jgi:hypothetical protein